MIGRVSSAELLIFTRQFSAMVKSRLPLVQALESLSREAPKGAFRTALNDVLIKVRAGFDFDRALADHPRIFNSTYVGVVRAGMQTGQLEDALHEIGKYLTGLDHVRKKIHSAMIYPLVLLMALIGVFHAMIFGILPRFETLFSQFDKELPVPTQMVLALGDAYASSWQYFAVTLGLSGFGFIAWSRTRSGRLAIDTWKLKVPVLGPLWRLEALARFAHTLSIQVQNAVSLIDAIRVAAPASNNLFVQASLHAVASEIENGKGITQAFAQHKLFQGVVQQMISAGEKTGDLAEPLRSVASYFESLWVQRLEGAIALVNPIMTTVIGALIAGMLIAAFLPVFEISGVAS
jgi:type IV pilus assembly protein PilC